MDHQLQRKRDMTYVIEPTKTNAGTRHVPMVALYREHYMKHIREKYNRICQIRIPDVTLNTCTHFSFEEAQEEMARIASLKKSPVVRFYNLLLFYYRMTAKTCRKKQQ